MAVVIDTNVLHVANQNAPQAGPQCLMRVIGRLAQVRESEQICLDAGGQILLEYIGQRFQFSGQPGFGDAFFSWLFDNQANPMHCELVDITPSDATNQNFLEFPNDTTLEGFDRSDRKFVAVALASTLNPTILNAVDSDWWDFGQPLEENGVVVENLCGNRIPTE